MGSAPAEGDFAAKVRRARAGDAAALDEVMPLVYEELRRIAGRQMGRERRDHTLQPTALVHEAYLRLFDAATLEVRDRAHFLALAARVMRRLLINHAEARNAEKRRGDAPHITLSAAEDVAGAEEPADVVQLDAALQGLAQFDARAAEIVEMRYFGGMTIEEIADAMDLSPATVKRDWTAARAWLRRELAP
jgi:RNA polymerase sigma factor (TIGR02999 family)